MSDYHKILVQEQAAARSTYNYDPRVFQKQFLSSNIEPFAGGRPSSNEDASMYTNIPEGSHSDPSIVQATPKTRAQKRYVIIDASQRDWVKQPNPFSNLIFSFGSQPSNASNPPVYENNPFVPTFAVEQSNLPKPIPGIPNTQGWSLAATPSNIQYKAYNSSLPKGNFIAYDTGYLIQPSGAGFGSIYTPCNVQSIRLIRAVLPQRQFLQLAIDPSTNVSVQGYQISQFVQSNVVGTSFSTFSTYPYLLFYLNEYLGQYVGGNEPMRRSFSVMTQRQRQQQNFQSSIGVQQYDYEPWGEEALEFQSPITNLQRLAITITDPIGSPFSQNDNLSIQFIQTTEDQLYLKCFLPDNQVLSSNDLRVGDRVTFYGPTISNLLASSFLNFPTFSQKRNFVNALSNATFPVLQLLDYVNNGQGFYVPRDTSSAYTRSTPYVSSFNGFVIPNFITIDSLGNVTPTYPGAIDSTLTYNIISFPNVVGSNLPFLNVSLQPVYTLEINTLQPDTGNIGGTIVL